MNASTRPNAEAVPPRNAADAATRFACPVLGQMTGARCVELFRDSMRVRSACSGCAAGKARSRLLAERPVQVVEVATEDPRVAELLTEVRRLTARLARVEVQLETVRNLATRTRTQAAANVRVAGVGFAFRGLNMVAVQEWCRQHNWSLSHLARAAIHAAAAAEGVELPAYASGVCRGFGAASPGKYSGVDVPTTWLAYLQAKRAERTLSLFIRSGITAYMEAHP